MKDKNLLDDNIPQSLDELTKNVNKIVEKLETEKDLQNSLNSYQELIRLNNIIEKNFQRQSKIISQTTKEKISKIIKKKIDK